MRVASSCGRASLAHRPGVSWVASICSPSFGRAWFPFPCLGRRVRPQWMAALTVLPPASMDPWHSACNWALTSSVQGRWLLSGHLRVFYGGTGALGSSPKAGGGVDEARPVPRPPQDAISYLLGNNFKVYVSRCPSGLNMGGQNVDVFVHGVTFLIHIGASRTFHDEDLGSSIPEEVYVVT